jgi:hypothetical protein
LLKSLGKPGSRSERSASNLAPADSTLDKAETETKDAGIEANERASNAEQINFSMEVNGKPGKKGSQKEKGG